MKRQSYNNKTKDRNKLNLKRKNSKRKYLNQGVNIIRILCLNMLLVTRIWNLNLVLSFKRI